jgi:hypothetical protein
MQNLEAIAGNINKDQDHSKYKAITALIPYVVQKEDNGEPGMLRKLLHTTIASGQQKFMWKHIEPLIPTLFNKASPLATILVSPHLCWDSPLADTWTKLWMSSVSGISHTDEVDQCVVDTLLQIASVESLLPYISDEVWSWLDTKPVLPPTCYGRSMGSVARVVQAVRVLGDIGILKSYLLLIWSEWDHILSGFQEMVTIIRENFGGEEMGSHRQDLLQHLDHILDQLDLGFEHFQNQKPSLKEDNILKMKDQYEELRQVLLKVHGWS